MELTHKQEKKLSKVFDNPKQLRKWIDDVYQDMINRCEKQTQKMIDQYLDIYGITVAYTLHWYCGFGKKRLPKIMSKIWNDIDCFKDGYLSINDCIKELKENGIEFDTIVNEDNKIHWEGEKNDSK